MAKEITKNLENEERYKNSQAEQRFYDYVKNKYPKLKITKKGMPDFMILNKKNEIIGFVEVKRIDLDDVLRKEQRWFRNFCAKNKIPYQVWSQNMARENWEKTIKNKEVWTEQTTNWNL